MPWWIWIAGGLTVAAVLLFAALVASSQADDVAEQQQKNWDREARAWDERLKRQRARDN